MADRALGNPLGNPLGLVRKGSAAGRPAGTGLASVKVADSLADTKWQYLEGQTITDANFKAAYGPNRFEETLSRLNAVTGAPGSTIYDMSLTPDDQYLAVGHAATAAGAYLTIYKRNGDGFSALATLPVASNALGVSFSPDGRHLAVCLQRIPGETHKTLVIFKRSGDTFTKLAEPEFAQATLNRCAYSPNGKILAVTGSTLFVLRVDGDSYTSISLGIPSPSNAAGVAWSPDGEFMAATFAGISPFFALYRVSGEVFSEIRRSSGDAIGQTGITFSPDGEWVAFGTNQPPSNLILYKRNQQKTDYTTSAITPPGMATGDTPLSIKFTRSSKCLVARMGTTTKMWRINNQGTALSQITPSGGSAPSGGRALAITSDDSLVIIGGSSSSGIGIYGSSVDAILPAFPGMIIKVSE